MVGHIKVDDVLFRFMGQDMAGEKTVVQKSVDVMPTTTIYKFAAAGVNIDLSFVTPAIGLDTDIVLASRPISHVSFTMTSSDSREHAVQLYFDTSGEGIVQSDSENVSWSRLDHGASGLASKLEVLQIGSVSQKSLSEGSNKINWGHWMLATPKAASGLHTVMQSGSASRSAFVSGSYFHLQDDTSATR